jgi:hypothetical protein
MSETSELNLAQIKKIERLELYLEPNLLFNFIRKNIGTQQSWEIKTVYIFNWFFDVPRLYEYLRE